MWHVLRTQPNTWIHAAATLGAVVLGLWLGLSRTEWAVLALTIGMVWTAELFNTALEALIDLASPEIHPLAKIGKDVGAAAVLIAAIVSVAVGLVLFGPPLWTRLISLTVP